MTEFYYTEPVQQKKGWVVNRVHRESKSVTQSFPFWTEKLAMDFLKEITITINNEVCYRGR